MLHVCLWQISLTGLFLVCTQVGVFSPRADVSHLHCHHEVSKIPSQFLSENHFLHSTVCDRVERGTGRGQMYLAGLRRIPPQTHWAPSATRYV